MLALFAMTDDEHDGLTVESITNGAALTPTFPRIRHARIHDTGSGETQWTAARSAADLAL
jgi:hypothetical protein